ncbi:hypothetical protein STCU_11929 [Strigomonas culicis]|uniref:Uncharacterized protein n=1 Tax=Strigomonas culicis TaxID=28005 RepID=S9TGV9_9TRYP|nr:hypothetical protein STCU_11929 [Strigomonas culicis]|eukprot:EPY15563.1 hypothetical protein STCU_11929 [Strigomonas culicis]
MAPLNDDFKVFFVNDNAKKQQARGGSPLRSVSDTDSLDSQKKNRKTKKNKHESDVNEGVGTLVAATTMVAVCMLLTLFA